MKQRNIILLNGGGFFGEIMTTCFVGPLVGIGALDVGVPKTVGRTKTDYHISPKIDSIPSKLFTYCATKHIMTVSFGEISLSQFSQKGGTLHYKAGSYSDGSAMPASRPS